LAERGGGGYFLFFPLFPNVFSSCSHGVLHIPKLFPKTFPIAPQLYPIWFAQSPTLMYRNWKRWAMGERAYLILFCNFGSKEVLLLGEEYPMFPKKW
jgi:hypothetical protein